MGRAVSERMWGWSVGLGGRVVADWRAMRRLCFNACAAANASVSVLNSFIVIYSTMAVTTTITTRATATATITTTTTTTTTAVGRKSNQRNYNSVKSALIKGQQQQITTLKLRSTQLRQTKNAIRILNVAYNFNWSPENSNIIYIILKVQF